MSRRRTTTRPSATLGLCLGAGRVGIAVLAAEHLVHLRVLNLRKLPTSSAKEQRFAERVRALLECYPVTRLALVGPEGLPAPFLEVQQLVLDALLHDRDVPLAEYSAAEVKRSLVPEGSRPTGRALAEALAQRFGAVVRLAPAAPLPSGRARPPSPREQP